MTQEPKFVEPFASTIIDLHAYGRRRSHCLNLKYRVYNEIIVLSLVLDFRKRLIIVVELCQTGAE